MRGWAAGAFTAVLSVAAHASAGGAVPSGAAATQLAILAITIGALAASVRSAAGFRTLVALLATGQLVAHLVLTMAGHVHGQVGAVTTAAMLGAHAAAVALGAVLIASGVYLWAVLSHVRRGMSVSPHVPVPAQAAPVGSGADQPLRSALLLAVSVSHRGPPVRACC